MEEVRQLVQEEGREARNLVAFHVAVDTPARVSRKPPRALPPARRVPPRATRIRSASAGRDKRSELRARYWALLFGDLQRAVGEIYNTVEAHENLNECQEVILVLENYTRDFKALGEWFRLKWEYDNTPPPQRPQSLAWEIRKTDFVRPESRRNYSVKSSPSVSGKNSPCLSGYNTPSGKNSPNLTGKSSPGSGKISPRISNYPSSSPKAAIEFFSNKVVVSKVTAKPEPKIAKESSRLSDINEKDVKEMSEEVLLAKELPTDKEDDKHHQQQQNINKPTMVEIGTAKEYKNACPKQVTIKSPKHSTSKSVNSNIVEDKSSQVIFTISQLDAMENNFLQKQLTANQAKNENMINQDIEKENDKIDIGLVQPTVISDVPPINSATSTTALNISSITDDSNVTIEKSDDVITATVTDVPISNKKIEEKDNFQLESPTKSEDNFADISNESSPKIEMNKTAIENHKIADKASVLEINSTINGKLETVIIESVNLTSSRIGNTELKRNEGFSDNNITTNSAAVYEEKTSYHENPITFNANSIIRGQNDKKIGQCIYNKEKAKNDDTNKSDNIANNPIESKVEFAEISVQDIEKNKIIIETKQSAEELIENNEESEKDQDFKKSDCKSNDLKLSSNDLKQNVKPAYSQAAAKPKTLSTTKTEVKTPTRLARTSNVVEIRPTTAPKTQKSLQKRSLSNKCSYPFNLTTGRTSLFDGAAPTVTTTKGIIAKRSLRNTQLVSGDCKSLSSKDVVKKRPPIPTSVKVADKTDKKERENPISEKNKDSKHYSSSDTVVAQIDASRIESSESLKTLVPDDHPQFQDVANSIEVLNVDNSKNDNDGWLTVKSRRLNRESKKHSKSHWANRFNQPSATTSLPTLNIIDSPKQEVKEIVDTKSEKDRAKSEQPESVEKQIDSPERHVKTEKVVKVLAKVKSVTKAKDPSMIRQKSDVTGLRTKSSRSKLLAKRAEKVKDSQKQENELTKNRLHSSLESLTSALARSQESTEGAFDFDKWKAEFKSTFKYLDDDDQIPDQNEILKTADPTEMSEIAAMTSEIEENERKISWALDFQSEVDQRKLCEEEDLLNRQILELQQVSDIDIDTETDDTETDAEILCEDPRPQDCPTDTLGKLSASLEDQYETALAGMSWAERVDTLVVLEALVARDPGRAQQLHAKLSQGIKRRGSLQDALRRLQAKQARAERQRIEYQTERAKKIHQLLARVEEVKVAKNQLIDEKRIRMERRLQKAAENRDQHLKDIVRKAHDEEEKLREIAFIKQLEAENRRHEFLEQCRTHTTRLRQMRRDQLHKLEQKAAREKAVGARRQALEAARKLHCESLVSKRRERDARVEELKELKKQERGDAAREKAEGIKSRLSALAAAAELEADALRSRIRDKQDASQQRLESHLQAIREKATTGTRQTTTSESQESTPKEVEESNKKDIERKEREKQKLIKRKARKLKHRLLAEGNSNPIFDETISVDDSFLNPMTGKVYKVISSIRNIIVPLVRTVKDVRSQDNDTINIEEDKNNKKKKKSKAENNTVNGNNSNNDEPTTSTHVEKNEVKGATKKKLEEVDEKKKVEEKGDKKKKKEDLEGEEKKNKDQAEGEKKKKKEKGKSGKASSVSSSSSDIIRFSRREKVKTDLDLQFLEKQMNELHRLMDKFERMNMLETVTIQRYQAVKVITQMLTVAAEKEDLNPPISAKCLTNGILLVSRLMVSCTATAAQLLATDVCVHEATLLAKQMEKNVQTDIKEMEFTKQLADSLSVALDSVLCASRLREEHLVGKEEEAMVLVMLRNRAHQVISYLCLTGAIARSEFAGEARANMQTLLTVCVDLCQPFRPDIGTERNFARLALKTALGKSICGSRAEFCMLFARGVNLGHCVDFVKAARTAHLLRSIAEMDHQIVQEAFGEGAWPLEFRAAVARLLSQHAPHEKEAPRVTTLHLSNQRLDTTLAETMVLDLIVLVGFVVVNNPQLQETICDGWSVIKTLCTLPANWLVTKKRSHALLPTLIALAERPASAALISSVISFRILEEFLDSPDAQHNKLVQVIKQARTKKPGKKCHTNYDRLNLATECTLDEASFVEPTGLR